MIWLYERDGSINTARECGIVPAWWHCQVEADPAMQRQQEDE